MPCYKGQSSVEDMCLRIRIHMIEEFLGANFRLVFILEQNDESHPEHYELIIIVVIKF